uniref:Glucuronosyltransferase n=1 Tax=Rhabditophanes sp. KR3021 TaxID=114890 RepID=A0AC35TVP7_9BILA
MVHLFSRILLLLLIGVSIESLKILFISPMMGKSHLNFVGRSADILVAAGHNVTLIAVPVDTQIKSTGTKLAHVVQLPRSEKVDTIWAKINNMGKSLWQHEGGNPLGPIGKRMNNHNGNRFAIAGITSHGIAKCGDKIDPFLTEALSIFRNVTCFGAEINECMTHAD